MQIEITISWRAHSFDGYRPDAEHHDITMTVDVDDSDDAMPELLASRIAEAAFVATNAPSVPADSLAGQIAQAIAATGYRGAEVGHYSLSVGDTVTLGEVTLACARFGWENRPARARGRPMSPRATCDELARRGTGVGVCDTPLDSHGQCPGAGAHLEMSPAGRAVFDAATRRPSSRVGPCPCACNSGGFCGGCGHAGCGGRR